MLDELPPQSFPADLEIVEQSQQAIVESKSVFVVQKHRLLHLEEGRKHREKLQRPRLWFSPTVVPLEVDTLLVLRLDVPLRHCVNGRVCAGFRQLAPSLMEFVESVEQTFLLILLERCFEGFRFIVFVEPFSLKLLVFEHVVCVRNELDSIAENGTGLRQANRKGKLHARPNFHVSFEIQEEREELL